ncbi:TonB-dependent receptor [Ideonella sp. DXS22W]|uniref:TonB-dependent receptor n=1 Tax=Pseudaquabacterium inlustre TaxID=2984192 RepID=A0ABU9CQN4_9BURK
MTPHRPASRAGAGLPGRSPAFRVTRLAAACGALLAGATAAQAQQAAPATPTADAGQQVVVTGIRRSVESALNLKRESHGIVDGIVAEDIGRFPDANLAEAMQRISGVAIDRNSSGEGSKVTVRGVGPDFNLVLFNGRQMPASTIAGTGPSNSRAFDFANLAAESISALEVYKTSRSSNPTGGIGATINVKTTRPLDDPGLKATVGIKTMFDDSNNRLPSTVKGDSMTPEVSGLYSNTFAGNTVGVAIAGSYQKRDSGYNQVSVGNGWRSFKGDENNWGTIPQPGTAGSERITNRPGANDIYSVPQNINYSTTGVQTERVNGQLTLQYKPAANITGTLDYTMSDFSVKSKRNDISAWFNFGPSTSTWTNGPVAAPLLYTEHVSGSDVAMGAAQFATKTELRSLGFNLDWKVNDRLRFGADVHHSTSTTRPDSPYGSDAVLGSAVFSRGDTTVDFSKDFPVLMLKNTSIPASGQLVTGSSFRNSYMKAEVDQLQLNGKYKFADASKLDFGLSLTTAKNRTAYGNIDRGTWGGTGTPADYPDSAFQADTLAKYFTRISGSNDPRLFNQWNVWDFKTIRDIAAKVVGDESQFLMPSSYSTDRRTKEESQSLYLQYGREFNVGGQAIAMNAGLRYESTKVTSSAMVPIATGITWGSNNELSVVYGASGFTTLTGKYSHLLPSIDFDTDLTDNLKLRLSYGESIGRPGWGDIQGGQTLDGLVRVNGGTGSQGNPNLKPLKSKNSDVSLEYYYAKSSYVALGLFEKQIDNYIGTTQVKGTPFNLPTPIGGAMYTEAVAKGCVTSDNTCIRNYILNTFNGKNGVVKTGTDSTGNATGTIPGVAGDPITVFNITVPANQRSAGLRGLELNLQHRFGNTGFGLGANYTMVMSGLKYNDASLGEQFALEGLGNSANVVGFWENDQWHVRAAYNWRGKFLSGRFDGAGANPVYTAPYGQLDMNLGYKYNKNLSFQLELRNLTDGVIRLYSRNEHQLEYATQTGRRIVAAARYTY